MTASSERSEPSRVANQDTPADFATRWQALSSEEREILYLLVERWTTQAPPAISLRLVVRHP